MPNTIIDRLFGYVATGDIDGAIALTTDDIIFEAQGPSDIPIYSVFKGHDGVRTFFSTLGDMFNTEAFEVRSTIENDNVAFGYGYMQHRVKRTERVFKSEWALFCRVRDGKITHYRMFEDTAGLVTAYL